MIAERAETEVRAPSFAEAIAGRRLIFLCGKGGAGKTTLAAALALALSERAGAVRLLGTDPAGTLPRVLAGGEIRGLEVRQVEAGRLLERFREEHGATIAAIIEGGTYLERVDAEALCRSSLPGMDEVLALLELGEALAGTGTGTGTETDASGPAIVIVDTAPSAHALRLLSLPAAFDAALDVLEAMREKARAIEEALAGGVRASAADRLLHELRGRTARLRAILGDPRAACIVPVAGPEPSSAIEAARLARELGPSRARPREAPAGAEDGSSTPGLEPAAVILNAREAGPSCCPRGEARRRSAEGAERELTASFPGVPVFAVPALDPAPTGVAALVGLGARLLETIALSRDSVPAPVAVPDRASAPSRPAPWPLAPVSLTLVGGKGGVGKSTIAAALAVARASSSPARRVLLASVNGGVGLSRALATALGDEPRPLAELPNLEVAEIDARERFEKLKVGFRAEVEAALDRLLGGGALDLRYDRAIVSALFDLAPPGIDEIAGLTFLSEAAERFDEIVIDCAPTGHLIRFLEMPGLAREWLSLVVRLLAKYPELAEASAVERTLALLRRARSLVDLFRDPARAALVAVALPEPIVADETERLGPRAEGAGVRPALLLVNRVEPPTTCPRCFGRRRAQLALAGGLSRALAPVPLAAVLEAPEEPRGVPALLELSPFALAEAS